MMLGAAIDADAAAARVPWWLPLKRRRIWSKEYDSSVRWRLESIRRQERQMAELEDKYGLVL